MRPYKLTLKHGEQQLVWKQSYGVKVMAEATFKSFADGGFGPEVSLSLTETNHSHPNGLLVGYHSAESKNLTPAPNPEEAFTLERLPTQGIEVAIYTRQIRMIGTVKSVAVNMQLIELILMNGIRHWLPFEGVYPLHAFDLLTHP